MSTDPIEIGRITADDSEQAWAELKEQISSYMGVEELENIERAYHFADEAHDGQVRKMGEKYINHPLQVALILSELKMDVETIMAALLHDVVEDTIISLEDTEKAFGAGVAQLVDGVTKITRIEIESLSEQQANNIRKMLLAMARDIRVIVIKLADRLHNMRTLQALREDRRLFKAQETMEIYAPLAHRLGISSIKWELEDLAFYYLEPQRFAQISRMVSDSREGREEYLDKVIVQLADELEELGIDAKITGRPKHLYSIYLKMVEKGKDFSEIYDLIALRIMVETVKDCYSSLGAVHTIWRPMPGRFKDYIAMPKFNMYQSLHTTVIGPATRPLEIQIRTKDMHRTSEYGVAAHWRYKGKKGDHFDAEFDEQLAWLRQILDWAGDESDPKEFLNAFKRDLTYNEVFVFTPKGEVINLRTGSTPIDFAYAIHTEVGNHCVGAKVNGNIVPLTHELEMGDRLEILTQKSSGPSRDWLAIVKTPSARQKIRNYFSKINRGDDILKGREQLGRQMRKNGLGISSAKSTKAAKQVAQELSLSSIDDLMVHIGTGKITARQVANRLIKVMVADKDGGVLPDEQAKAVERASKVATLDPLTSSVLPPARPRSEHKARALDKKRKNNAGSGVVVKGMDGMLVRLAHCCNPVPGDDIIGFVTRGRGVSVHRQSCPNAKSLLSTPERIIEVQWEEDEITRGVYQVEVYIEAVDRLRLLTDVTMTLANGGVNVLGANTASHRDGIVDMRFLFEVGQTSHIDQVIRDLRAVDGVIDARRMLPGEQVSTK